MQARNPLICAGQGVLYAEACDELLKLAELLRIPIMTTLEGKSAFPEDHPLSLGTGARAMTGAVYQFLQKADVVFGVGCSFTRHGMFANVPDGKIIIHATNDERGINKDYPAEHPILGDAKLVLRQFLEAVQDLAAGGIPQHKGTVEAEIEQVKHRWLNEWMPKLTSDEVPLNPYRIIWEFVRTVEPKEAIVFIGRSRRGVISDGESRTHWGRVLD